MRESVPATLRRLKSRAGISLESIAKRAGYRGASSIQRYFSETDFRGKYLPREVAEKLADAFVGLGETPINKDEVLVLSGLLPASDNGLFEIDSRIEVIGAVQAGAWLEALQWETDERYSVAVPISDKYHRVYGLEVRGPSMNKRYPEGTVIVCVKPQEYGEEPKPGKRVVVERRNDQGLHEATVKELRADDSGLRWLWPDSTDPNYQTPIRTDGGEDVEITGIVIGSWQPED